MQAHDLNLFSQPLAALLPNDFCHENAFRHWPKESHGSHMQATKQNAPQTDYGQGRWFPASWRTNLEDLNLVDTWLSHAECNMNEVPWNGHFGDTLATHHLAKAIHLRSFWVRSWEAAREGTHPKDPGRFQVCGWTKCSQGNEHTRSRTIGMDTPQNVDSLLPFARVRFTQTSETAAK